MIRPLPPLPLPYAFATAAPPASAPSPQRPRRRRSALDGPFAETKEMLGAYGLIEALLRPAGPPSPAGG